MYKRGLAFLLAAVLAFSPVMQVNAAQISTPEMQVETAEETQTTDEEDTTDTEMLPEETEVPSEIPPVEPLVTPSVEENPTAEPVESAAPEESAIPEDVPTENPEESASPEESMTPDASPSAEPAESMEPEAEASAEPSETPEASVYPEESAEPSESPEAEESASPEESVSPEIIEADTGLENLITTDIDLYDSSVDESGEGYTWVQATKTFTMNGYHSKGQLRLPDGSTLVLAEGSENIIDKSADADYGLDTKGKLTITGSGKLTIKYKNRAAIRFTGTLTFADTNAHFVQEKNGNCSVFYNNGGHKVKVVCSNVKIESFTGDGLSKDAWSIEGCDFIGGMPDARYYYPKEDTETGLYEMMFKVSPIQVTTQPQRINKGYVGETVELQIDAKSLDGKALSYQWYSTTDVDDPDRGAIKISGATGKKLTVSPKVRGLTYYFCKVKSASGSANTELAAVVFTNPGMKICTQSVAVSETTDKLATEGWKFDASTNTFTMENMDLLIPFPSNYSNVQIRSGYNVVINGTNYLDDNDGRISITNAKQVGKITTISGTGTLYADHIFTSYLDADAEVHYKGGLKLVLRKMDSYKAKTLLDGVTVQTEATCDFDNDLELKNGAKFEAANYIDVAADLIVGDGCTLLSGYNIVCNGSMSIGKNAIVIVESYLDMDATSGTGVDKNRTLRIDGTFYAKGTNGTNMPIRLYSEAAKPMILGDGVRVITPEDAVWEKKSTSGYDYGFKSKGSYYMAEFLIGPKEPEMKTFTAGKQISGTPKYGYVLTVGEVTPADATVSYQWQSATSPTGPWDNIYGEKGKTFLLSTRYHGAYIRVVTKGVGTYKGEVISDPVGPVAGDQATLTGIRYEGGTGGTLAMGYEPFFDGHDFEYTVSSDMTAEGTVNYAVTTANSNAKVTIRNKTTQYEKVGKNAAIPVVTGLNKIEIEVNYGGRTTIYTIEHTIKTMSYTLYLYTNCSSKGGSLTATWKDENGQTKTRSTDGSSSVSLSVPGGAEVTITSTTPPGRYPFLYSQKNLVPDLTKPGYPATFVMQKYTSVYLNTSDMMAYPPEGLNARWSLSEGSAQVAVKALAKGGTQTGYERIELSVFDSDGFRVGNKTVGGSTTPEADGYYRTTFTGLDSTKEYKVEAYYYDLISDYESAEKQTASFTLKKRTPVSLDTVSDYVVLRPGDKENVSILYDGYYGGKVVVDAGFDTGIVSAAETKVLTDASGNNTLQIKAVGEGTTYITLRGDDYENAEGMQYVFTTVRVDVSSAEVAESLRLGVKKGTLNLYDDSVLTIPVYQMACGHEIEGAVFADAALNEKFAITVVNDRTLKIVPKVPADDGTVDFAKWVKESGRTGTFSSKIIVKYDGTSDRESTDKLTITLTAKKPETKVTALSFNSFYTSQTKNLKATVKGEKVAKIQVDSVKTKGTTVACPSWLSVNETAKSIEFNGNTVPANKTSKYIYLKIWPEGYRMPIQTKVKVNVAYTTPKLKVNKSTLTIGKNIAERPGMDFKLVSGDKNVKYQNIGVQSLELMSYTEYMKMSAKTRKGYVSPEVFDAFYTSLEPATGMAELYFKKVPTSGKVVLYAHMVNGKKPVKITFNLKVQSAPTLAVNKKSVTMDAIYGSYPYDDEQKLKLTCSASGYQINNGDIRFEITMVGDETKADCRSHFSMWYEEDAKAIRFFRTNLAQPNKTYKVSVYVAGIPKPATFTIKVIQSKSPRFKASKTEVTLNRLRYNGSETIKFSIPDNYGSSWNINTTDAKIIKPDGTEDTKKESLTIETTSDKKVYFAATNMTQKGTYTVKIPGAFYSGIKIKPVTVKVKVVDKFHSLTAAQPTLTLNKDLAEYDKATTRMTIDYSYRYPVNPPWSVAEVLDAAGNDAYDKLTCRVSGADVTVAAKDAAEYGATYKVKLLCKFACGVNKSSTITVKIAPNPSQISLKGKASGYADTTRPNSSYAVINYTGTNWHAEEYTGQSKPVLEWEVYAKKDKKLVKTADGALADNGLVAKGDSKTSAPTAAGSWFKDVYSSYQVALQIDTSSAAWKAGDISPDYTYTVKATLKFPSTGKEVKVPAVTFKVKQGTVKFSQSPKTATLNKLDDKGRSLFAITNKSKDYTKVAKVAKVEVVANKDVPVSKKLEIVPVYSAGNKTTYAVHWKDREGANVKSGTVKVNIYLEGNDPARKKPNASFNLKVTVK